MEFCSVRGLINFIACSVLGVLELRMALMYLQDTIMSLKNLLEPTISHRLTIDRVSNCNYVLYSDVTIATLHKMLSVSCGISVMFMGISRARTGNTG